VSTTPSLDAFLAAARREFAFLVSDFGFTEQALPDATNINPFKVAYVSDSTRVTIEGINWGMNSHVMVYFLSPTSDTPARVPLWALVELRAAPDDRQSPSGQIAQLSHDASLLRRYASDVLRGDFSAFPAASRIVEDHAAALSQPSARKLP
jgi:hypothetical protein